MTLFDRYVAIDWSAAASPRLGADSIWTADLAVGSTTVLANHPTRHAAARWLDELIESAGGQRVLVGVDASLGYPRGSATHFGLGSPGWRAMWDIVAAWSTDDERNRNNRFDVAARLNELGGAPHGPFWGCPDDRRGPALRRTKPPVLDVPEFRYVEQRLRDIGRYPKSCWQLIGAGTVGGQTLTLLPILGALLDRVEIWPFTTGLRVPNNLSSSGTAIVVAEVWPSWFVDDVRPGHVRDAEQVAGTVAALCGADDDGRLGDWFSPEVGDPVPITREEGWILGIA